MNKLALALFIVLFTAAISMSASAQGCAISPNLNHPLMPDSDCDGIIDMHDNCPFITNPLQQDSDMNGLGDACDIYLESIGLSPSDQVYNGRAFTVTASILNNRPYNVRNMRVRVFIPDLGIESVKYIDNLNVCKSQSVEFNLRAPVCSEEKEHTIYTELTFMNDFNVQETIGGATSLKVMPDSYCQAVLENGGDLGNTYVSIMEIQDVTKGSEAVFPIKISNTDLVSKDYIISVTGLDGWGQYRLTPNSLIIVPSESDRVADLFISAKQDTAPGERAFVVTIQDGEEFQRFLLIANVKENPIEDRSVFFIFGFKMVLITLVILLIIAASVFGAAKVLAKSKAREPYY
jgi:hypothetical protein